MNISLRKASALQNSIQDTIRSIKIEPTIRVNEFVNPERVIVDANTTLVDNDARRVALSIAYYNIRSLVGAANVANNISMKLATAAFIDSGTLRGTVVADLRPVAGIYLPFHMAGGPVTPSATEETTIIGTITAAATAGGTGTLYCMVEYYVP
jgi:hypothetical protein